MDKQLEANLDIGGKSIIETKYVWSIKTSNKDIVAEWNPKSNRHEKKSSLISFEVVRPIKHTPNCACFCPCLGKRAEPLVPPKQYLQQGAI